MRKISKTGPLETEIETWGGRQLGAGRKPTGTAMTGQERTGRLAPEATEPIPVRCKAVGDRHGEAGSDLAFRARRPAVRHVSMVSYVTGRSLLTWD
jgi:hypothetical protein